MLHSTTGKYIETTVAGETVQAFVPNPLPPTLSKVDLASLQEPIRKAEAAFISPASEECHRRLMQGVRGKNKQPGELRRSQVWLGGTRPGNAVFVPPLLHVAAAHVQKRDRTYSYSAYLSLLTN